MQRRLLTSPPPKKSGFCAIFTTIPALYGDCFTPFFFERRDAFYLAYQTRRPACRRSPRRSRPLKREVAFSGTKNIRSAAVSIAEIYTTVFMPLKRACLRLCSPFLVYEREGGEAEKGREGLSSFLFSPRLLAKFSDGSVVSRAPPSFRCRLQSKSRARLKDPFFLGCPLFLLILRRHCSLHPPPPSFPRSSHKTRAT